MLHLVDDDDDAFSETDMAALEQAMVLIRTESPGRAEQIDSMLEHRDWEDVAMFAASVIQSRSLRLKPWQEPPAVSSEDDPEERDKEAQALLRRMLAVGISRYEPDPLAALAEAEKDAPY